LGLDPADDVGFEVLAREPGHLLNPSGAGDVDLRELASDDVETHEPKPIFSKSRYHGFDDLAVCVCKLRVNCRCADVEIRAKLTFDGDAQDGAQRFPIEEQDTLVSFSDLGNETLHHGDPATLAGYRLDGCVRVEVGFTD